MAHQPLHLLQAIEERKRKELFRALPENLPSIDFSSNDYLGFSKLGLLSGKIKESGMNSAFSGSTGSRLISGNSDFTAELENLIAGFHSAEAALLFNSGYDANLGLISAIATKNDLILYDELVHASIHDGIRLSFAKHYKFRHNNIEHLTQLIERNKSAFDSIYIVVESIYSMDGNAASLKEIAELCGEKIFLIVDEAHAIGVFGEKGKGLCNELNIENKCFARVYTYGKAMGCHGAAVVGSKLLRSYLVNFARSFIYTTALPPHSLFNIKAAYLLLQDTGQIEVLKKNIQYFNELSKGKGYIPSESAIHCRIFGDIKKADTAQLLAEKNDLFVKSIKSPTVKEGTERLRICLHSFNSKEQIEQLINLIG
jgi:8-amino-7-oxononanoate synthase